MLAVMVAGSLAALAWALIGRASLGARGEAQAAEAERIRAELRLAWERVEEERRAAAAQNRRIAELEADIESARVLHRAEQDSRDRLHAEQLRAVEMREQQLRTEVAQGRQSLQDAFRSLVPGALKEATGEFLKLADERFKAQRVESANDLEQRRAAVEQLVKPIADTLKRADERIGQIEKDRTASYAAITQHVEQAARAQAELRAETGKLVRALREPKVRGMYGEVQLKRVAELAGMRGYCDFAEQEATRDADGNVLRPDMIVRLPSGRVVAVDAKANLKPYLEALEATEPAAVEERLGAFADGIAAQASLLSRKEYWKQFDGSPEFVVMFVPGDQFVDAALAKRPDLLDMAASQGVLLASPCTLIALLRAVHVGFQERRLAEEARELLVLGRELHERAAAAMEHVGRLGGSLEKALEHYNRFVGSYESRLEPTLRKFEESGVKGGRDLPEVKPLTLRVRMPQGQALLPGVEESGE